MRCKATPALDTSPTWPVRSPCSTARISQHGCILTGQQAVGTICVLGLVDSATALEVRVHCRHSGVCNACRHVVMANQREKRHREKEMLYFAAIQHRCKPVLQSPTHTVQSSTMSPQHANQAFDVAWSARGLRVKMPSRRRDRQKAAQELNLVVSPVLLEAPFFHLSHR